jgi:roadblock/LC7 domain-containing protein
VEGQGDNENRKYNTAINEKIAILKEVSGYICAGIFTADGEMLGGDVKAAGIDIKMVGSLVHDALLNTQAKAREAGFGEAHTIQVDTLSGYIFCKCYNDGTRHFHTVLILNNTGNVALAKVKLQKAVRELAGEF